MCRQSSVFSLARDDSMLWKRRKLGYEVYFWEEGVTIVWITVSNICTGLFDSFSKKEGMKFFYFKFCFLNHA